MAHADPSTFGILLRHQRLSAGLTQEELAERAQISARAISDLERGVYRTPKLHTGHLLAEALGLTGEDRAAFEAVARGAAASGLPLQATVQRAAPDNLPVPITPFLGRSAELRTVCDIVSGPDVRMVTLTGPGGAGKTRLAIEVARRVRDEFPHGVFFVSLAAIDDFRLVLWAVARALGISPTDDRPVVEALQSHIGNKHLLLVLDNLEHLQPVAVPIHALLEACPELRVLITSRVLLHLSGEHHFPVPPMALPPSSAGEIEDVLETYDATALFIERARAVNPAFVVTQENASVIVEICTRLDGLPLAIELAAARVSVLTPPALLDRLSHGLTLLSRGPRDAPPRQQTMRATIDWSYRLLGEAEQRLLARLAVFVGGWTLDAAQAVCAADGRDIFEDLSSLVESSLLRVAEGRGGEPRFLMLETIREYVAEKLAESGDGDVIARRHVEYFVGLAEAIDAELGATGVVGPLPPQAVPKLGAERDNLAAALTRLREQGEAVLGLRLISALGMRWMSPDPDGAHATWLGAFDSALHEAPPPVRARMLLRRGDPPWISDEDVRSLEEAIALYREADDERLLLRGLLVAAQDLVYHSAYLPSLALSLRVARAEELFRESIALARTVGAKPLEGASLRGLGDCALRLRSDWRGAEALFEESLAVERRAGNHRGVAESSAALGAVAIESGDLSRGATLLGDALACLRTRGQDEGIHPYHFSYAVLALKQGNLAGIVSSLQGALRLGGSGYPERYLALLHTAWLQVLASFAAAQGDATRAARLFGAVDAAWGDDCYYPSAQIWMHLFASYRASVRALLGETAWTVAWAEGHTMTPKQAIAYALEDDADTPATAGQLRPGRDGGDH